MFFSYYPKVANPGPCLSGPTLSSLASAIGIESFRDDEPNIIKSPKKYAGQTYREVVSNKSSWSENDVRLLQDAYTNVRQKTYCHWRENEHAKVVPKSLISYPGDNGYLPMKFAEKTCKSSGLIVRMGKLEILALVMMLAIACNV